MTSSVQNSQFILHPFIRLFSKLLSLSPLELFYPDKFLNISEKFWRENTNMFKELGKFSTFSFQKTTRSPLIIPTFPSQNRNR